MPNERLRAAMVEHGLTHHALADELGVNVKSVERWVAGDIVPFPRNRHRLATRLARDESYLWPDALTRDRAAALAESELVRVYPHRADVPADEWRQLFESGDAEIGILVYAGLFLAEDSGLQRILRKKAKSGARVRILLGDPDDANVAERGEEEGIGDALAAKIRNVQVLYRGLVAAPGIEFRLHRTVLYNSIYRADDRLFVNTHIYGLPAAQAPLWHLRKIPGGELAGHYLESFERVWDNSTPMTES
ncbi:transcriptional regulator with XRE-family HTH domain [Kribbella aluminosa]|uniref:Transcriptional regulator with XRE-family HTH domain n=1 Tax=Kribbella aluminosa TaxID=416017 RepID=A0ABS4UJL7_9ACTN|nr:helix-turn-helix transcriptional regulator [Kribbella aluminosa]MBP2351746.1 transcriptional regulator with XRE-family HTH domain [Kribbella aluminosa]